LFVAKEALISYFIFMKKLFPLAFGFFTLPLFASSLGEQSIGFYANGSLKNPNNLGLEGEGFVKLFRNRDRAWGNDQLIDVITETALMLKKTFPYSERIQVGDLSQKIGGKISGHNSHQNGLDVDLVYFRVNHQEQEVNQTNGFSERFVFDGKLTANFDLERNWAFVKLLASKQNVQRIFMDPIIKKAFCDFAKMENEYDQNTEVLRKFRPLAHHDDHIHVRLLCPEGSKECTPQEAPPIGSGCDSIEQIRRSSDSEY
jgi:penicillin-insensitive murein endopeptidase